MEEHNKIQVTRLSAMDTIKSINTIYTVAFFCQNEKLPVDPE
jgi:hypothetical protein